ncbi:kappaPI-actitoxin-Avd3c [Drosophila gunungcola]|uniref:kappaPI-actitoxin-Avd3c n=1 Tax=Drosophila gunungcola TaxID=103775 RepID=UPI0022DFC1F0|nr:kappaPI-actitoxin-Avd3c [Drosophila gunungcola]
MLLKFSYLVIFLVFYSHLTHSIKRRCLQPLEEGTGKAYLRNWFYNSTSHRCQRFIFFGGVRNGNNFDTQARCRKICLAQLPMPLNNLTSDDGA